MPSSSQFSWTSDFSIVAILSLLALALEYCSCVVGDQLDMSLRSHWRSQSLHAVSQVHVRNLEQHPGQCPKASSTGVAVDVLSGGTMRSVLPTIIECISRESNNSLQHPSGRCSGPQGVFWVASPPILSLTCCCRGCRCAVWCCRLWKLHLDFRERGQVHRVHVHVRPVPDRILPDHQRLL